MSDSVTAMNAIYEGLDRSFPLLCPDFDIQSLLHACVTLNFVPSQLNVEADSLAQNGVNKSGLCSYWA